MRKIYSTAAALFTFFAIASLTALVGYAQKRPTPPPGPVRPKVTQVQVFAGWQCPVTVGFEGKIFVTAPLTITYQWQRSDGTTTPVQTAEIAAPFNHPLLKDTWHIMHVQNLPGGNVASDTLHVLTPANVPSQTAEVHLQCK